MARFAVLSACLLAHADAAGRFNLQYIEDNLTPVWASFKQSYAKSYASVVEEAERKAIFLANMRSLATRQAENPHAEFGPSPYSDLTDAEFTAYHSGYKAGMTYYCTDGEVDTQAQEKYDKATMKTTDGEAGSAGALPRNCGKESIGLNWQNVGVVSPTVSNQGTCGGCWAFSAAEALSAAWAIRGHPVLDLSPQELISCVADCDGCDGGTPARAYEWLINSTGGNLTTAAAYPYVESKWSKASGSTAAPCAADVADKPMGAQVIGCVAIPRDEVQMYAYLQDIGPFSIAVDASDWRDYKGGILSCPDKQVDHSVLLVGHGYAADPDTEYWVVKNSWGPTWGENGYLRIQFGVNACGLINTSPVVPIVNETAPVPGVIDTPDGEVPAVIVEPPLDPYVRVPVDDKWHGTCISGRDCVCPQFMLTGKTSSDFCNSMIMAIVSIVVFSMMLGCIMGMAFFRNRNKSLLANAKLARELKAQRAARHHKFGTSVNDDAVFPL
eukprot:gene7129-10990_t